MRMVEPDILVKLLRQVRPEIMARHLSFWPVDHANRPLKTFLTKTSRATQIAATATTATSTVEGLTAMPPAS